MGIIALSARKAFLARKRKDYREYKKLTDDQLEQRMLKLPVQPPIWYKLTKLQKTCFIIGAEQNRFSFFNQMGTGKTLLAIALIRYFRRLGLVKRVLVLVPNRINKNEWQYELEKHSPKSSCLVLPSNIEEKWEALEKSNALFVFETYAGLYNMACVKQSNKKGKNKLVLSQTRIKKLQQQFQALVCDESVSVGNHQGLPFRICRQLSKTAEVVFTMTGTPFNRDPTLLWAQMYLVDHGYTLGETLGLFRSVFCSENINFFSGHPEYHFLKKNEESLQGMLANASIAYAADEASLPERINIQKFVSLGTDATSYYNRFKDQLIAARGNFQETKNAFLRLRQISSGFIGYEDDETGERAKFEFPDNPKMDLLLSLLSSMQEEYKAIVFFEFTYSGERILDELKKLKIPAVLMYGKTKDVNAARQEFLNKKRVLILQNKFGVGLNVQVARYGIHFESAVSAITRKQCDARVHRQHSSHESVFMYDLLVRDTVDAKILEFHREGSELMQAIVHGKVQI